jgi:pimeloyl-ACP methyl ester carboxylesterase
MARSTPVYSTFLVQYVLPISTMLLTFQLRVHFAGWFTGLSSRFLAARTARLLVLAGTDRLDKELMIGQMQGKFQLVVVPGVGHMLHEVSHHPDCCYLFV